MNTIQVSTAQLMKLPLHILQRIAGSNDRSKRDLSADIAINLASGGVRFVEAEIDPWYVRIEYNGTKIGGIDTTRGKQDYTTLALTTDNWSKDWEALILSLFASMELRDQEETDCMEYDDLAEDAEDVNDQSLSPDERDFIRDFGELADNILSQIGRTDCLELIKDDHDQYRVVDTDRDGYNVIWTRYDTRLWGTSVYSWGKVTPNPLEHLTDYVNRLS